MLDVVTEPTTGVQVEWVALPGQLYAMWYQGVLCIDRCRWAQAALPTRVQWVEAFRGENWDTVRCFGRGTPSGMGAARQVLAAVPPAFWTWLVQQE